MRDPRQLWADFQSEISLDEAMEDFDEVQRQAMALCFYAGIVMATRAVRGGQDLVTLNADAAQLVRATAERMERSVGR